MDENADLKWVLDGYADRIMEQTLSDSLTLVDINKKVAYKYTPDKKECEVINFGTKFVR